MKNKKYIFTVGIIAIAIIVGAQFFVSHQKQSELKEDTMSYLSEEGYDVANDIQKAEVFKIMESSKSGEVEFKGNYQVAITFENEPDVTYSYAYKKETNEIEQFVVIPSNKGTNKRLKHKESEQVQVLH